MSSTATLAAISRELDEAAEQARLGYEFSPGSYTYSALRACLSARDAFAAYRAIVDDETGRRPQGAGHTERGLT